MFLQLVRAGINADANHNDYQNYNLFEGVDWMQLKGLADAHGMSAIVLDGLDRLNTNLTNGSNQMPKRVRLEWIGEVLQQEQVNAVQQKAAGEMALLLHEKGIRTYVLKGQVIAECYPRPEHRVSVDLDCFLCEEAGFKFQDSSSKSEATPET